ncbi:type II toxin-antitoxin system prevent-host-death family antitoxin [Glycomyces sp. A-F 0318]|uniref:type II toxin-antitoxin system Phd/YefM family antitoxin n=1 Tax=Glycomyces amatae TaxID=2881355 RepID=UPI001E5E65CA|nr:type II toxin-antitoxin system prevent-host-death family antitoxin [Glycomyces amatae]MCD0447097.1 type II toxin-antitoxin system prevent-host-death family antitoxin [Glycomyces amatae]
MKAISFSQAQAEFGKTLDTVIDDREEAIVVRDGHESVVIVALDEYESLKETAYLLSSPVNARRLLASIDELENGRGVVRDLIE